MLTAQVTARLVIESGALDFSWWSRRDWQSTATNWRMTACVGRREQRRPVTVDHREVHRAVDALAAMDAEAVPAGMSAELPTRCRRLLRVPETRGEWRARHADQLLQFAMFGEIRYRGAW